jgi:phosphate transport system permease protein
VTSTTPDLPHAPVAVATPSIDLRPSSRRLGEKAIRAGLALAALVSVVTTVGIVLSLLLPAIDFFREVSIVEFFTTTTWAPLFEPAYFGVLPLVTATFVVTFWALLVAVPAGIGTAIYLSEYASPRARNILKPILEILAGIPTVVFGYFALTAVTPLLRQVGIQVEIFNVLAGGLVLGAMLIPTVASLSEDAMSAVPRALRDGSYGLGADRLQTSLRVVVPAAISGIIAAIVLAISRAVGETMIVLIAVGQLPNLTFDPRQTAETLTAFIGATGNGDLPTGSTEYKTIFAVGLTLFVITFVMNVISIRLVRRYREAYD